MSQNILNDAQIIKLYPEETRKDISKLPELIITEISAIPIRRSTHRGGYIAVYNTTDHPLSMGDYLVVSECNGNITQVSIKNNASNNLEDGMLPPKSLCLIVFNNSREALYSVDEIKDNYRKRVYRQDKYYPEDKFGDDVFLISINNDRTFFADVPYIESHVKQTLKIVKECNASVICQASTDETDGKKCTAVYYSPDYEGEDIRVMKRISGGREVMFGRSGSFPFFCAEQCPTILGADLVPVEFGLEFRCTLADADSFNRGYIIVKTKHTEASPVKPFLNYTSHSHDEYYYYRFKRVPETTDKFFVLIPQSILFASPYLEYSISVMNGYAYYNSDPVRLSINQSAAPEMIFSSPSDKYVCTVGSSMPLCLRFDSANTILPETFSLKLDGKDISDVVIKKDGDVYEFSATIPSLAEGVHLIEASLSDALGNTSLNTIEIKADDHPEMTHFLGDLHGHTEDSDGSARPYNAYKLADELEGSDFIAITDHNMDFMWYMPYLAETHRYFSNKCARASYSHGGIMPIFGFECSWEMVHGFYGHMNIINAPRVEFDPYVSLSEIYSSDFTRTKNCFAQFNHPYECWGTFCDFGHHNETSDNFVRLYEMNDHRLFIHYNYALMKGWHISPAHNNDDHFAKWTSSRPARTVIISPSLNRDNLLEAIAKNRTYRSASPDISLDFSINGEIMGSRLSSPETLNIKIKASDKSGTPLGVVYLYGENCTHIMKFEASDVFEKEITLPCRDKYLFVRIHNPATNSFTVSAPIWTGIEPSIEISDQELENDTLNFTVASKKSTKAAIEIYETNDMILDLSAPSLAPSVSFDAELNVGKKSFEVPFVPTKQRIYVFVKTETERASCIINHSDLIFTEAMPLTSPHVAEDGTITHNPFSYVKIKNISSHTVDLGQLFLRRTRIEGLGPDHVGLFYKLPECEILPNEQICLWWKPMTSNPLFDNLLGEEEMRKYLNNNEKIVEVRLFPLDSMSAILALDAGACMYPITGAKFNIYQNYGKDIVADTPVRFKSQRSDNIYSFPEDYPIF